MNKRIIIAILITILVIFATNKTWLSYTSMSVDFDIKGNDEVSIEVQLNKNDDAEFKKTKSESITLNITKPQKAKLSVYRAKSPKRFRMFISEIKDQTLISVSNIQLQNGQYKLNHLDKMEIEGATVIKRSSEEIIFKPEQVIVKLTYPETLNIKAKNNFDVQLLIIIAIMTFLLAFQLSNYIADFKTIEGKSRIDICFLIIFFTCLFIPMSHISKDNISERENRVLTEWQPLIVDGKLNYNFGTNFNNWFNDRFYLRQPLVNLYSSISLKLTNKTARGVYDKDNGFMYLGFDPIGMETINNAFNSLLAFNDFCKKHNIKLYVLIIPNKQDIYKTKMLPNNNEHEQDDFRKYVKNIYDKTDLKVVYPYEEFVQNKDNDYVFFKTEHHMTDYGSFLSYQALMKEIQKDYPNVKATPLSDYNFSYNNLIRGDFKRDFHFGTTSTNIGLTDLKSYHNTQYKYYTHKDIGNLKQEWIQKYKKAEKIYYYPKGADLKVIQLGTSHNENLTEFIPVTFKNVRRIRNNTVEGIPAKDEFKIMKYYEKTILDYKPDIIIFCIGYTNIEKLSDMFNKE